MFRTFRKAAKKILNRLGYRLVPIASGGMPDGVYDYQDEAISRIATIRPYTMKAFEGLLSLYSQIIWLEKNDIAGDIVECGVWKGGSMGLMALANLSHGRARRKLHCFDVFDDICEPDPEIDGRWALEQTSRLSGRAVEDIKGRLEPVKGFFDSHGGAGKPEEVRELLEKKIGYQPGCIHIYPGWFQDTMPAVAGKIERIAMLHLDCDWYASIKTCLENLYDQVVPRGFVVLDDYGCYEGARRAVDEFLASRNEKIYLNVVNRDIRYFIKP